MNISCNLFDLGGVGVEKLLSNHNVQAIALRYSAEK